MKRKSIELASSNSFTIEEVHGGTRIHGMLAYPGISKNLKLYTIDQLLQGHGLKIPIWLNHADAIGIDDIGPELLPDYYRKELYDGEVCVLGEATLTFNPDTLQLMYDGIITDSFYKRRDVLQRMSVSQGVVHPKDLPQECDSMFCYTVIQNSIYEEMSLVFHPGFSIATLSTEHIENDHAYQFKSILQNIMENNSDKSKEGCGCGKSGEVDQASGVMSQAGNCGEGMYWDKETETCKPVNESGNSNSNAGSKGPSSVAGHEADNKDDKNDKDMKKTEEALDAAQKALEKANEELSTARKAVEKSKEDEDKKDLPKGSSGDSKVGDKQKQESKKNSTEGEWVPNQDTGSRARAQEAYNEALEKKYKAIEMVQTATSNMVKTQMIYAREHAKKEAIISSNTFENRFKKASESTQLSVKQWMDNLIKSPENTVPYKTWRLNEDYLNGLVTRKFKSTEGLFLDAKYTPYKDFMEKMGKSIEASDVQLAGGTATGDVNNWQRTLSELVLVYPDGRIITPIQQFCETAILLPGKAQHIFYDVNVPSFQPTDEAFMDAAGSGYALAPSEITVNPSGGKTNPSGTLTRIGFTQLEEIPIDLIQKINIGLAMEAENQKNLEILTTCYNDDTAYNPATNSIRPKGGGNKGAADDLGNTHWINGNNGNQLTTTDSGATSALTFAGLLAGKGIIGKTGLDVSNLKMYLDYQGILQLLKDTSITTYTQRSVPEVITEGYIEKISGVDLIASSQTALGDGSGVFRAVMFIPVVSFGFVTGRELQVDAERVARQQSVFVSGSMKVGGFCKKIESTCRVSFKPSV